MKKTTMKDIASIANVSVATVSYVLNNVDNQSIPESTKCKILQIARDLEYTPNLTARSLAKKKTGLIGILINKDLHMPYWKRQNYYCFIDGLEKMLTTAGYHSLLVTLDAANPSLDVIIERSLEAVFLVDVKDEFFYTISSKFVEGVPLILIDSLIEDKLFNQITYDFHSALEFAATTIQPPYCLIMENYNNKSLIRYIQTNLSLVADAIYTVNDLSGLDAFMEHTSYERAIVINEFIGNHVERSNHFTSLAVICTCNCPEILANKTVKVTFEGDKSSTAFNIMENIFKHVEYNQHKDNKFFIKVKLYSLLGL
jgi:transcriptional regulator with XRE-family HTH domain